MLSKFRKNIQEAIHPIALKLNELKITPNKLTTIEAIISIPLILFLKWHMLYISAILIMIIGALDTIDGIIARVGRAETKIGALYDATVDRFTEFAIFIGFILSELIEGWLILLLFFLSYTVSYIRARAESIGGLKKCNVGIAERSERLLLIVLACILGIINVIYLKTIFIILVIITSITIVQRAYYIIQMVGFEKS